MWLYYSSPGKTHIRVLRTSDMHNWQGYVLGRWCDMNERFGAFGADAVVSLDTPGLRLTTVDPNSLRERCEQTRRLDIRRAEWAFATGEGDPLRYIVLTQFPLFDEGANAVERPHWVNEFALVTVRATEHIVRCFDWDYTWFKSKVAADRHFSDKTREIMDQYSFDLPNGYADGDGGWVWTWGRTQSPTTVRTVSLRNEDFAAMMRRKRSKQVEGV